MRTSPARSTSRSDGPPEPVDASPATKRLVIGTLHPLVLIHLLRHGISMDRADPACPPDPERALTDKGRQRTKDVARGWARLEPMIDGLLVSPYRRAVQTAEVVAGVFAWDSVERRLCDALIPMGEPSAVVGEIARAQLSAPLLVGHAPNLDLVIAFLVGARLPVTALKKAGLATLEVNELAQGGGRLAALYTPSTLRELAER